MNNKNLYAVILAGGIGTRLWPLSRQSRPKQVQSILSGATLLQQTFALLRRRLPANRIYLVANREQELVIKKQLPQLPNKNILLEPQRRHTAAAIALANMIILEENPQAIIMTANTDGYIPQPDKYWQAMSVAVGSVAHWPERIVSIGIKPIYAETGYGYIQLGRRRAAGLYQVQSFREKPSLSRAKYFVSQPNYLWNSGIYIFSAPNMQIQLDQYLPEHSQILSRWQKNTSVQNRWSKLSYYYHRLPKISIDVGIIEKQKNMLSVKADFIWQDIGHWRAVRDIISSLPDKLKKNEKGKILDLHGADNLIKNFSDRLVVAIDLQDMIIINMNDVVLVCPSASAQNIKQAVKYLKQKGWEEYL